MKAFGSPKRTNAFLATPERANSEIAALCYACCARTSIVSRKKKGKKKQTATSEPAIVAPQGPATNLRPGGPMADRRLRRRRTRQAEEDAALEE